MAQCRRCDIRASPIVYHVVLTKLIWLYRANRPYNYNSDGSKNFNRTQLYTWSTSVTSAAPLASITLPPIDTGNRLHIYGISLTPAEIPHKAQLPHPQIRVHSPKLTTRWTEVEGVKALALQLHIANTLPSVKEIMAHRSYWGHQLYEVEYFSPTLETVGKGFFSRLMPGDEIIVDVLGMF